MHINNPLFVLKPIFVYVIFKVMENFVTPLEEHEVVSEMPVEQPASQTGDVPLDTLKNVFGYDKFRGKQQNAVNAILNKNDCVVLMPTGGGKTVCYAVPGIILPGVTIVITPLIALILDQVQRLRKVGLTVCYLVSSMKDEEKMVVYHNLSMPNPSYKFLFTTPETITTPNVKRLLQTMSANNMLAQFVVDEAHCIDCWGFNFRPSYSSLGALKDYGVPMVALTATATDRTVSVITLQLRLDNPIIVAQSFLRSNLHFSVVSKKSSAKDDIAKLIGEDFANSCGIVYCMERKDTIELAYTLNAKGINATYFHGALDPFEKKETSFAWLEGRALVMCATSAFGMGIDKANVRFVIHHTLPKSPVEYYQEAGRAGRDGAQAKCIIFFKFEDRGKQLQMITSLADNEHKSLAHESLNAISMYCINNGCRTKQLLQYFGEVVGDCNNCDACHKAHHPASRDASEDGKSVVQCVEGMLHLHSKVSLKQVVLTFIGSKQKEVTAKKFNEVQKFASGKGNFSFQSASKFIQLLIVRNILKENIPCSTDSTKTAAITIGPEARALTNDEISVKRLE